MPTEKPVRITPHANAPPSSLFATTGPMTSNGATTSIRNRNALRSPIHSQRCLRTSSKPARNSVRKRVPRSPGAVRTLTAARQAALITNVQASSATAPPVETRLTKTPPSAAPTPNEMLRVMPSSALACCKLLLRRDLRDQRRRRRA